MSVNNNYTIGDKVIFLGFQEESYNGLDEVLVIGEEYTVLRIEQEEDDSMTGIFLVETEKLCLDCVYKSEIRKVN